MKAFTFRCSAIAAGLVVLLGGPNSSSARDADGLSAPSEFVIAGPISTGSVTQISPDKSTMTIQATQRSEPITFHGLDRATVVTGSGRKASVSHIQMGSAVTVFYSPRKSHWVVSKVVIPEPIQLQPVPLPELTGAESRALQSSAANDDDITTQPSNKARIDNDITTQPGKNALAAPDRTKRPK